MNSFFSTGGDARYFLDSVLHFSFTDSVFDLAMINTVKVIFSFLLIDALEDKTLKHLNQPHNLQIHRQKFFLHAYLILLHLAVFAFATIKGGLILDALLNDSNYPGMHLTFNILAISSVVFAVLELILALLSFTMMKRLASIRVEHFLNQDGQEVDKNGQTVKKKATLSRLISMAGPVSITEKDCTK